jgi:hypothetical protein
MKNRVVTNYYVPNGLSYTRNLRKLCCALKTNAQYQYEGSFASDEDSADYVRIGPIKAVHIA